MAEFDPSQPFTVPEAEAPKAAAAPEFDPGKPFTVAAPAHGRLPDDAFTPGGGGGMGLTAGVSDPLTTSIPEVASGLDTAAHEAGRSLMVAGPAAVKAGHGLAAFLTRITPDSVLPPGLQNKTLGELYDHFEAQDKATQAKLYADHPLAANLGMMTGAAITPIPGAGVAGGLSKIAGPALRGGAGVAVPAMEGLAGAGLRTAGMAGLSAADIAARGGSQDDIKSAAELGGGVTAGLEAIPYIGKGMGYLGTKAARAIAGVTEHGIDRYIENPQAVDAAAKYVSDPSLLKNEIDSTVGKVTGEVDTAKAAADQAAAQAAEAKLTAKAARGTADQNAADAFRAAKEGLDKTGAPEGMAGNIVDSLNAQGENLGKMSGQAFDILEQEGHAFKPHELLNAVESQMGKLQIGGVAPKVGPDAAAYGALGQLHNMIGEIEEKAAAGLDPDAGAAVEIPAGIVKELIQTLDRSSKAAYGVNAGALGPEAAVNLAKVRSSFNGILRDASPAYAAQMDQLAPQVTLVADMSKVFGDEKKAMTALAAAGNPDTPQGYAVRQLLNRYDQAHGTTYLRDLEGYFKAKDTLNSPTKLAAFKAALPEVQAAAGVLPEEAAADEAQQGLAAAQQTFGEKKLWAEPVSKLGPNSTENVIKSVRAGRNFEAEKQLRDLDEMSGTNHLQNTQDAGVANEFSRSSTNGSRKAVWAKAVGTAVGSGLGAVLGGHNGMLAGGVAGHAVGATLGMLSDTYGGQAVKAVIDAGINIQAAANSKYMAPLMEAAKQGPKSVAIWHFLQSQRDPGWQALQQKGN